MGVVFRAREAQADFEGQGAHGYVEGVKARLVGLAPASRRFENPRVGGLTERILMD